jgi:ParB family transcriptional regulator, chromosome partitioning protein
VELEPRTAAPAHATGAVAFVPLAAVGDDATFRLRAEGDVGDLAASIGRLGQLAPVELRPLPGVGDGPQRYQIVSGFRRMAALRLLVRDRVLARIHLRLDDDDAWGIALTQALLTEPLDFDALDALRTRLADARIAPWAADLVDEALVRAPIGAELREQFFAFLRGEAPPPGGGRAFGEAPSTADPAALDEPGSPADTPAGDAAPVAAASPQPDAFPDAAAEEVERSSPAAPSAGLAAQGEPLEPGRPDVAEEAGPAEDLELEVTEVTPEELAEDLARRMWEVNQDLALAAEAWADLPEEGRRMVLEQARWAAAMLRHLEGGQG